MFGYRTLKTRKKTKTCHPHAIIIRKCMIKDSLTPDLVLIDDDELIQAAWKMTAREKGHQLICFRNVEEFKNGSISKHTPIYIDFHIGDNVTGLDVAGKLHQLGFEKLHITTGSSSSQVLDSPIIKSVVTKDYPL